MCIICVYNGANVSSEEVLKRANLPSIESILLQVQLRWAGHVTRMEDVLMPKAVFFRELQEEKRNRCARKKKKKKRYKDQLKRQLPQVDISQQKPLLAAVKGWKLVWFGHVTRHNSLSKPILQGSLEGEQRHGRQKKCWMVNIKEWTSLPLPELLTKTSCRKKKNGRASLLNRSSCPPGDPVGQGTELD